MKNGRDESGKTKVKICGIRSLESARTAAEAGADFLGFNFVATSKRYISPNKAKRIMDRLSGIKINFVGVFQDERLEKVNGLISYLKLNYVQLHGNESPKYVDGIRNASVIKTFSLPSEFEVEKTINKMKKYKVDYFLLDREKQGRGESLNPDKARKLSEIFPIILAGGLMEENVSESVKKAKPLVIDVAGGVETYGKKDKFKIQRFIDKVHFHGSIHESESAISVKGYFGEFGGQFVTELLYPALRELEESFEKAKKDYDFQKEYKRLLSDFAGRPTPLYLAKNSSDYLGFTAYFKREDLSHGGSHKINNALGQALLAKYMGKKRIVTETAAGMQGVAAVMAANVVGLKCHVYMGVKDIERQKVNADKIKLLGGEIIPVARGNGILKDAVSQAQVAWIRDLSTTHYLIGSTIGPHPFPTIVAQFQKVIGMEAKKQVLEKEGKLPKAIIACGSGGSNALGIFQAFISDKEVELIFVEGGGESLKGNHHAAVFEEGTIGIFQGTKTYLFQDEYGMDKKTETRAAGLNYPARGPELSYLFSKGRIKACFATDNEVLAVFYEVSQREGIIPAFETCHALVELFKRRGKYKKKDIVILNFSGRGDKDINTAISLQQTQKSKL